MRRMSDTDKKAAFDLYTYKNLSTREISKILGFCQYSVLDNLRRYGCKIRTISEGRRRYETNEHFFDEIDTEEKAYILGFLYADGYNNEKRGAIKLSLMEDDKEILEKITKIIQPNRPIMFTSNIKKRENGSKAKDSYYMLICSKHMSKSLASLGCMQNKTFKIKFPSINIVPKHLQSSFIRGYFDGDGGISVAKNIQSSITGTVDFLHEIQNILYNEIGFNKTKLVVDRYCVNNIAEIRIGGKNQIIKFGDYLYKNANIFLKRKKDLFDKIKTL